MRGFGTVPGVLQQAKLGPANRRTMRLPTRSAFAVVSPLRPEDARLRLSAAIGTPTSDERPFSGRIDGRSFDVMRSTRGRNSLRPRIRGTIEAAAGGSRIEGTMQLHGVVIALVAAIIALPTLLFVSLLRYSMNVGRWESSIPGHSRSGRSAHNDDRDRIRVRTPSCLEEAARASRRRCKRFLNRSWRVPCK